mmetsp:Transcript_54144/g.158075  ORF Transcript_54144/g.158075 Transcript_54144/m.158075 type:complete len:265 (-) Transcript_54144:706-1500(-)
MALPACCPGRKAARIAGTRSAQGISTAPGTLATTMVLALAFTTDSTRAFCLWAFPLHWPWASSSQPSSSEREARSLPSEDSVPTKTTATSAEAASLAAAARSWPSSKSTSAPAPAAAVMPSRGLTTWEGTTLPEPPPWTTALAPAKPRSAKRPPRGSGRRPPSFFKSTVESAASRRAEAMEASLVTLFASFFQSQEEVGSSMTPTRNMGQRIRTTASSRRLSEMVPASRAGFSSFSFIQFAEGISMSRPSASEGECVAPQSDIT